MHSGELTKEQIRSLQRSMANMNAYLTRMSARVGQFNWKRTDPMVELTQSAQREVEKLYTFVTRLMTKRGIPWSDYNYFPDIPKDQQPGYDVKLDVDE
jgi:2'-5' RNA ligase